MSYTDKIYTAIIICFAPVPAAIIILTSGVVQLIGCLMLFNMGYMLGKIINRGK